MHSVIKNKYFTGIITEDIRW